MTLKRGSPDKSLTLADGLAFVGDEMGVTVIDVSVRWNTTSDAVLAAKGFVRAGTACTQWSETE